jgi:3-oxoacyl-[acyl-carrier protein] reductase
MSQEQIEANKAKIPMGRLLRIEEIASMVSWIAWPGTLVTTGFRFDRIGWRRQIEISGR